MPPVSAGFLILQSNQAEVDTTVGYPELVTPTSEDKAFRIPAFSKVILDRVLTEVDLSSVRCIADQGSDINVVTLLVVEKLKLRTYVVAPKDGSTLSMGTADGKSTLLRQFVIIKLGVLGIWREVHAFVRPDSGADRSLLLGLPWLHDVCTIIDIRGSNICIGNPERGEKHTRIVGPTFQLLDTHKPPGNNGMILECGRWHFEL
jgi:hypothetical protein